MMRIVFVCHGNICRSPMAEVIFRQMLAQRGATERFDVDSAAVSAEETGSPTDARANAELQRHGMPRSRHIARPLMRADYERCDRFLAMDADNLRRMQRLFGGDPQGKARLLLGDREVADPWYTGCFDRAYRDIEAGCRALLDELLRAETQR